jgi:hypothetical protein
MPKRIRKQFTEVTNEQLARMIAEGFAETATKRDLLEVEQRLDGRIDGVETGLAGVETQLARVKDRLNGVDMKVDRALYSEMSHFDTRLRRVERRVSIKK